MQKKKKGKWKVGHVLGLKHDEVPAMKEKWILL